ncbi:MAG TPA: hypothetical protein VD930_02675 [Gemmatimonadales bacterium]|nr:hypothetical protein [Gemmatimonadales bacterium]
MNRPALLLLGTLLACNRSSEKTPGGSAACGLASLAGPTALLSQFSVPDQTLASPPRNLPERLVVRLVAGPAYPAIVGRSDSLWLIGVEGSLPSNVKPGFGVLILDQQGKARGTMLYEGTPVEGAPSIGSVSVGDATVPLIGIQLDPERIEDPRCPTFPDSILQ